MSEAAFNRTINDIYDAILDMPPAALDLHKVSGSQAKLLVAQFRVYRRALKSKAAARAGIVGVGLITYAEQRLATFNRRIAAKRPRQSEESPQ